MDRPIPPPRISWGKRRGGAVVLRETCDRSGSYMFRHLQDRTYACHEIPSLRSLGRGAGGATGNYSRGGDQHHLRPPAVLRAISAHPEHHKVAVVLRISHPAVPPEAQAWAAGMWAWVWTGTGDNTPLEAWKLTKTRFRAWWPKRGHWARCPSDSSTVGGRARVSYRPPPTPPCVPAAHFGGWVRSGARRYGR